MESSSNNELIKQIKRYQFNIQQVDPPENDTETILYYIRKLSKLPIKLEELEKTGIGKTINALRKRQGNIGAEAKSLVVKWKSIAKRQVQEKNQLPHSKNAITIVILITRNSHQWMGVLPVASEYAYLRNFVNV